jgi:arylsulfatase A
MAAWQVPCVVSWPGRIKQGSVCRDIIDFSDMLPTLCEAAGVTVPEKLNIDGKSFLWQLVGRRGTPREAIYIWYSRSGDPKKAQICARDTRYKLYSDGRFYDVENDRLEETPLQKEKLTSEEQTVKAKLLRVLERHDSVQ